MTEAQNPLRLLWRAVEYFVLNCDDDPIANADTKREVAFIALAVNHHDALVVSLEELLDCSVEPPERNCSCHISPPCNDCVDYAGLREVFATARALLAKIGETP